MIRSERLRSVGKAAATVCGGALVLGVLMLASTHNYLLFHSLVESFGVVISCGIFMIAWNARRLMSNGFFLLLGIGLLAVAVIDFAHMLAYTGMGVFESGAKGSDLATQLWVGARYLHGLTFIIAPFFLDRAVPTGRMFAVAGGATGLLLALIFGDLFPRCFTPETGLTGFKIWSEYAVCALFLTSGVVLWRRRRYLASSVLRFVVASIGCTVASEVAFTLYWDPYGTANLVGHVLKIVSFYLVYKAMIEIALTKPFHLLFLSLKQSEEALRAERQRLAATNEQLQRSLRLLEDDETAGRQLQFHLLPPSRLAIDGYQFDSFLKTSSLMSGDFVDYFPIGARHIGFYIADVSGHGVSSAFITVLLKGMMNRLLDEFQNGSSRVILEPAHVLRLLNRQMLEQSLEKFLTIFYCVLETARNRLLFSNAGQFPCPVLASSEGAQFIDQNSLPVGLFEDAEYQTTELDLPRRFEIGFFSDGVFEILAQRTLAEKREFLRCQFSGAQVTLEELINRLRLPSFRSVEDDITILLLTRKS